MDFKSVLSTLIKRFDENDVHYALIGGLALGLWGVHRATVIIEFLMNRDSMERVEFIMQELDYSCKYRTENVSQYLSPFKVFGEVDFLHAFRKASLSMLERAEEKDIFDGEHKIKILRPEDLIGLKIQSMHNEPTRESAESHDIESLMATHRETLDMELIEGYFKLFEKEDILQRLSSGKKT